MTKIELLTPKQIKKGMLITAWYNCGVSHHAPLKVLKKTGRSSGREWKEIICIDLFDPQIPIRAVFNTDFYFFSKFHESHRSRRATPQEMKKLGEMAVAMFGRDK